MSRPKPLYQFTIPELKVIAYDLIAEKERNEQQANVMMERLKEVNREISRQLSISPPPEEESTPAAAIAADKAPPDVGTSME